MTNQLQTQDGPASPENTVIPNIIYALYGISLFLGITSVVAVMVAHIKRSSASGTWLESHYRWQIRTFWFSALWIVLSVFLGIILEGFTLGLLGGALGSFTILIFAVPVVIWYMYRVVKGWLNLAEKKQMYVKK